MRSHSPNSFALAGLLGGLLTLAIGGCGSEDAPGTCGDGCPSGQLCEPASGTCMVPASAQEFGLEVLPPANNQGWVRQEFMEGRPDLALFPAVSLQGIVHASDDKTALPARVRLWRESQIPGRPVVFFETTTPDADKKDAYVLWLTKGLTYSLFVTPQPPHDETLPPALEGGLKLDDHDQKDVVLDGADRAVEVAGQVLDATGKPLPFSVQVRAIHEGGWLRSTVTRTCSAQDESACNCGKTSDCYGKFSFRIPFGVRAYKVRVEGAASSQISSNSHPDAVPTMECEKAVLGLTTPKPGEPPKMMLTAPLKLPPFPLAQEYTVTILGADQKPVMGAQVTFESNIPVPKVPEMFDTCTAVYRRTATTDEAGKATLPLLPGGSKNRSYRLTVLSPAQSPNASKFDPDFEIGPSGGTTTIELAGRHELRGRVVDAQGRPVANTRVEAQGFTTSEVPRSLPLSTTAATTDGDGEFVLHVDPGTFHFHCSPPETSGVPRFSWLAKEVKGSIDGLVFAAPEPTLLVGKVLLPSTLRAGKPANEPALGASGFTLNAYQALPGPIGASVLRATALTDASGIYRVVLPRVK